jgi:hypothetical protein
VRTLPSYLAEVLAVIRPMGAGCDSHVLANVLNGWLSKLPQWDPESTEGWMPFLQRYGEVESLPRQRLERLPGCRLGCRSPRGPMRMTLAGVSVRSYAGVPRTCRLWIATARAPRLC